MEIAYARCKIRDFRKLMEDTRLALQEFIDACEHKADDNDKINNIDDTETPSSVTLFYN